MKVILQKDVANVGQKGDIKDVKDGFFRNFLMPQKLAEVATPAKVADWEKNRERRERERGNMGDKVRAEFEKTLPGPFAFVKKVNDQGHLYDRVDKKELAASLLKAGAVSIKEEWIILEEPLKEIGEFEIEIKTPFGVDGIMRVAIAPERNRE